MSKSGVRTESFPRALPGRLAFRLVATFSATECVDMTNRRLFLVAYDISHPGRGGRVLDVVKAYSTGGQKSVHECWLDPSERADLTAAVADRIDPVEDSVVLLRLDPRSPTLTLGIATQPRDPRYFYVG